MSTHKNFNKICYAVLAVTLVITVLFMNGKSLGIPVIAREDTNSDMFTVNDLDSDWDSSDAVEIILSDSGSTTNGNGAYVYDGDIYIACAGQYIISGNLSDGSIIINADKDDKIWLMFNGVSIHCNDNSALKIDQASKVFMTLADETENTLSSGSNYSADAVSAGIDAVIYSHDDLTINGNGTLDVTAEYKHGIVCNDNLVITGGTITVNAVQDAIHANDSVRIKDADITASAGDDGITVSNNDETAYFYMESGKIKILSCYEGIEAIDITVAGGTIDIVSTDDGINANGSKQSSVINITGGDITITNSDGRDADGLDSNKDIYISGGNLLISVSNNGSNAIDYGSENGGVCKISGGTVIACGSSGMAEGFDSSSTQGFIMYTASAQAGTTVALENSNGKELISAEVPYSFSSVVVSTPEINVGDTCTLIIGESKENIMVTNTSVSSNFGQGGKPGGNLQNDMNGGMRGGGMKEDNQKKTLNGAFDKENNSTVNVTNSESENTTNQNQPDMQTPPDRQDFGGEQDGANSTQPPEIPDGADSNAYSQDFSKGNGNFENHQNGERPNGTDNNSPGSTQKNNSSNKDNNILSKDNIIYLSVSFLILIIGCIIASVFKKRK